MNSQDEVVQNLTDKVVQILEIMTQKINERRLFTSSKLQGIWVSRANYLSEQLKGLTALAKSGDYFSAMVICRTIFESSIRIWWILKANEEEMRLRCLLALMVDYKNQYLNVAPNNAEALNSFNELLLEFPESFRESEEKLVSIRQLCNDVDKIVNKINTETPLYFTYKQCCQYSHNSFGATLEPTVVSRHHWRLVWAYALYSLWLILQGLFLYFSQDELAGLEQNLADFNNEIDEVSI